MSDMLMNMIIEAIREKMDHAEVTITKETKTTTTIDITWPGRGGRRTFEILEVF